MCDMKSAPAVLSAAMVRRMFLSGACNLENQKEWINELNVFPVPDGDTGTNMSLTVMAASDAVRALEDPTIETTVKAISSGSLRGARGNSGVILSQLFRGFSKVARDYDELDVPAITRSMERAVETAYKAVMKPKEGTILTVARCMAEKATEVCPKVSGLDPFFEEILKAGKKALDSTPELLPVLKEAGVVDSGGQGLLAVIEGAVDAYRGHPHTIADTPAEEEASAFLYDVSFRIACQKDASASETEMRRALAKTSSDLQITRNGDEITVRCQTEEPGSVLQAGLSFGHADHIEIAPAGGQSANAPDASDAAPSAEGPDGADAAESGAEEISAERRESAFIAVCCGEGMASIFREVGVDYVLEGGQTMNPSADDILAAVRRVNADVVYVLPNNKNIVLTANQAAHLAKDCRVVVVPTETVPQGITAVVSFVPENSPEDNLEAMIGEIANVKTGEVTYSVRDTRIGGVEIRSGDIMGIGDGRILAVGSDVSDVVIEMLGKMIDDDSELVSIYYGSEFDPQQAEALAERARAQFPQVETELNDGGQPVYYVILSVE